jgi:hypothetical protein
MRTREALRLEDYFAPWDRWFENRIYPSGDGISSFFTDITARKRAEQEIRRQRDILDRTSRLARVGGWEFEVATLAGSWTDETARIKDMEPQPHASVASGLELFQGLSRAAIWSWWPARDASSPTSTISRCPMGSAVSRHGSPRWRRPRSSS